MASNNTQLGSVVVIGGCGFLGHHIVKELLADPTVTSVSVMSRNPHKNRFDDVDPRVSYSTGDITLASDVKGLVSRAKPDVVINTASPVAYINHEHAPSYEHVNVLGNENLLGASRAVGTVKAYIYTSSGPIIASSGGAYDQADETYPTLAQMSKSATSGGDPYHLAKARGDALVLGANDPSEGGMRTATIRPTAMYGEGDRQMIANLLDVHRQGNQTVWLGDNTALMDSVYVGSVARAHVLAARRLMASHSASYSGLKVDGEAFNITDDAPLPPWSFFRLFWIEMGDTTPLSKVWIIPNAVTLAMAEFAEWWTWTFSWGKLRPKLLIKERIEFLLYTRTYSIQKARERLGYEPVLPMAEAVRRAVKWALQEWPEGSEISL